MSVAPGTTELMGWNAHGVKGRAECPPPIASQFRGATLLIAGSGRDLWADLARAPESTHAMCVNFAGSFFPRPFEHWSTMHAENMPHWLAIRQADLPQGHIWTHGLIPWHGELDHVESKWDLEAGPGCSGLFGCYVGLAMGYDAIVLAGVPEDGIGHFYDPPGARGTYSNTGAEEQWTYARDRVFAGRVKSLSGLTRALLGEP